MPIPSFISNLQSRINLTPASPGTLMNGFMGFSLRESVNLSSITDFTSYGLPFKDAVLLELLPEEFKKDIILEAANISYLDSSSDSSDYLAEYIFSTNSVVDLSHFFNFLPKLNMCRLYMTVNSVSGTINTQLNLEAVVEFGQNQSDSICFFLHIDFFSGIIQLSMPNSGPISPIFNVFGFSNIPANIQLEFCSITLNTKDKSYNISLSVKDLFNCNEYIVGGWVNFEIEALSVYRSFSTQSINEIISGQTLFKFKDKYSLAVDFTKINGTYTGSNFSDTILTGVFDPGTKIPITEFVDQSFLPDIFRNAAVENLGLTWSANNGFSFQGTLADLITIDSNQFSVTVAYGPNVKEFSGTWDNSIGTSFNTSNYGITGGISSWIIPEQATLLYTNIAGISLLSISASAELIINNKAPKNPLLSLSISRTGGNDISAAQKTITASIIMGEIVFMIDGSKTFDDSTLQATLNLNGQQQMQLNDFICNVGPYISEVPPPSIFPNISFNSADFTYDKKSQQIILNIATGNIQFNLCGQSINLNVNTQITSFYDEEKKKRVLSGSIVGIFQLGLMQFDLNVTLGAVRLISLNWNNTGTNSVSLLDFFKEIHLPVTIQMPSELDVTLSQISLLIDCSNDNFKLTALTTDNKELFVVANKLSGSWGFFAGIFLAQELRISDLPKIGKYMDKLGNLTIQNEVLICSTITQQNVSLATLELPALSQSSGQMGTGSNISTLQKPATFKGGALSQINTSYFNLTPGVMIGFELDISKNPSSALGKFSTLCSNKKLFFLCEFADPISQSFIQASLGATFNLQMGSKKIQISNPVLKIGFDFTVAIAASFQLRMGTSLVDIKPILAISETEMDFSININADSAQGIPFGLKGMKMDQLGMEMALFFEPPSFGLGLSGNFHIINQVANSDDFALIVSIDGDLPNVNYFSCFISQLNIRELLTAFSGNPNPQYPAVFDLVNASDLSLYWCDDIVTLPDGTTAMAGFGFNGNIQIFNFYAHAGLNISSTGNLTGNAQFSPINWSNVLSLSGNGQGVSIKQELIDGNWQPMQNHVPGSNKNYQQRTFQVVPAGGAVVAFQDTGSPYINIDFNFSLFSFIRTSLLVELTNQGFLFDFHSSDGDVFQSSFTCSISGQGFSATADASLQLNLRIPSFQLLFIPVPAFTLSAGLNANFSISVSKTNFNLQISGNFEFDGHTLNLPTININIAFSSIKELIDRIGQEIKDHLSEIFKEVFSELTGFFDKGFADIKHVAEQFGNDVKVATADVENFTKGAVNSIEQFSEHAWSDIENGAKEFGENLLHGIEKFGEELGSDIKEGFDDFSNDVKEIWGDVDTWFVKTFEHKKYEEEQQAQQKVQSDITVYEIMTYTSKTKALYWQSENELSTATSNFQNLISTKIKNLNQIENDFKSAKMENDAQIAALVELAKNQEQDLQLKFQEQGNQIMNTSIINMILALEICLVNQYGNISSDFLRNYLTNNFGVIFNQFNNLFTDGKTPTVSDLTSQIQRIYNNYFSYLTNFSRSL